MIGNNKSEIRAESCKVGMLADMLGENINKYCAAEFRVAGYELPENKNTSKTAIRNQITTLRNELLVLAEEIKKS